MVRAVSGLGIGCRHRSCYCPSVVMDVFLALEKDQTRRGPSCSRPTEIAGSRVCLTTPLQQGRVFSASVVRPRNHRSCLSHCQWALSSVSANLPGSASRQIPRGGNFEIQLFLPLPLQLSYLMDFFVAWRSGGYGKGLQVPATDEAKKGLD